MALVVVHPAVAPESGVWVVFPAANCPLSLEEIARKDVPAGLPYVFVDAEELPDPAYREAWDCDFSEPDGFGIGHEAWFAEQDAAREAARIAAENALQAAQNQEIVDQAPVAQEQSDEQIVSESSTSSGN